MAGQEEEKKPIITEAATATSSVDSPASAVSASELPAQPIKKAFGEGRTFGGAGASSAWEMPNKDTRDANTAQQPSPAEKETENKKAKRTRGLKIFDVWLYPIFTNGVVFLMSVAATYLTGAGSWKKDPHSGEILTETVKHWWHREPVTRNQYSGKHGWWGEQFFRRGEWLKGKCMEWSGNRISEKTAGMWKMVTFSFIDGSFIAPFVKIFEDRREKIGRWIDKKLGTLPEDEEAAYEAEPKQSWLSVLGGRFATLSVVLATALALNEIKPPAPTSEGKMWDKIRKIFFNNQEKSNLNDLLFSNPGLATGEWAATKPGIAKFSDKVNIPELSKVGFFEAFYTSVCTAGLYYSSRFFATITGKKHSHADKKNDVAAAAPTTGQNVSLTKESTFAQEETIKKDPAAFRYHIPPTPETHLGALEKEREDKDRPISYDI